MPALIALVVLGFSHRASSQTDAAPPPDPNLGVLNQGTRTTDFDDGWKFQLVNTANTTDPTGRYGNSTNPLAAATGFDDASWQSVTLPHDWSILQAPSPANSNATGYFPGGLGWYRKTFTLPAADAGKKISIDFDGVFDNSYVYLNGQLLGNHPYGYTGYSYDISGVAHTDGTPNVLAVVVQNAEPSSRWYSGSGITRHVHLTVTNPVHITRDGIFVTTPGLADTVKDGYATVHATANVIDESGAGSTADIAYTVRDASGAVVGQATSHGVALSGTAVTDAQDIRVDDPHLWSTDTPYLYTLETDVSEGGNQVDSLNTTFGIRWITIDPNGGVSINGQHIKLQGVDLHNDEGALGSVDNYDALWRQMSILKSEGVNAFRTSHNPPSPEMIDVCQRLGIVMMVEAFDAWGSQKLSQDYHLYFNQWSDYDIKEMVNEAKNSPAVMMWSIGNEIPGWTNTASVPIEQRLVGDIKSIDPTRPVVAGSDQYRSAPRAGSGADLMVQGLDGLGLNYNPAKVVDQLHAMYPDKFFFESESSSETSTRGYYQDPDQVNTGPNQTPGKHEVSSYDNNLASWTMSDEYGLKKDRDRQYFAGQFIWSGFDYIGEPTPYGVFPVKSSFFGTIDTAGFPKDAYYLFQSQWTSKPMVHLLPMNWTDYKPGQDVEVWTYSNAPTVELFLNGVSLGAKSFDSKTSTDGVKYLETTECSNDDKTYTTGTCPGSYQSPNGSSGKLHLTWHVPFAPGKLVAVARDADGNQVARDEVDTAGAPYTLKLIPDKTVLRDDGKSLSYIETQVVDKDGVMVPDADNHVTLNVTGAGTFAGADNGKEDDAEPYYPAGHDAFNGKVLEIVQAKTTTGPIHVTASADGLVPATTTLYSSDQQGSALVAVKPVEVRAELGSSPSLPATVTALHADNSTETLPVTWDALPPAAATHTGVYTVDGTVQGTQAPATATVTVYRHASIQSYSTAVAVGEAPMLPAKVRLIDSDGVATLVPVTWDAVDPSEYAAPGHFSVLGSVAGTALKALATVRVTDQFAAAQNIARSGTATQPSADASFTGSGAASAAPAAMLDGTTTSGGWTNRYVEGATNILPAVSLSHASDWVTVGWPHPQHTGTVTAFFTTNANNQLPAAVDVSYWTGDEWKPVSHEQVNWATASNAPTTITFDPVSTTKLRFDLTSATPRDPTTGNVTIAELQVTGDVVTLNSDAALSDLKVDGRTVPGFDPGTLDYANVGADPVNPQITATAADNGTVRIQPPLSVPGTATVTVTSEDGSATKTYTLALVPSSTSVGGGVGGTVPPTLALSLGAPASFGAFTPGVAADYTASTSADVVSTAGDAVLSVADPDTAHPGHLVNGTFALPQPLQAQASSPAGTSSGPFAALGAAPLSLLSYAGPVSHDPVSIAFKQSIGADDALRTGSYSKTLTFTLSTDTP